jgi:hypothetical protein
MPVTYEPIATTTLSSAAASITLSSIPATYTDLRLVMVARCDLAGNTVSITGLRFNGDSSANYSHTWINGDGGTADSLSVTNSESPRVGRIPAATATSDVFGLITVDVFSYLTAVYKTFLSTTSSDLNGSGNVIRNVALWRSTSAITSLTIIDRNSANFVAGTTATLYGIKNA